jgi:putative FmdB family regulatory protein
MPIYEYRCEACGRVTSQLVLSPSQERSPACRACASPRTRRVMSRFAHHRSEASRLADFDPSVPRGADYYKDSRNVGLWAKKRAQELGADLGPQFEETLEKARTGKILDEG